MSDYTERYSRHLLLEDFGGKQQELLRSSRVFVAGAGGLGSSVLPLLVAGGVGEVVFCEFDIIEVSNLQRQILYRESGAGKLKSDIALESLRSLNSDCKITALNIKLTSENIAAVIDDNFDLVFDCTDNFPTRYLIADHCWKNGLRLMSGAIVGWDGQVMAFFPEVDKPCLRCLMPQAPENPRRAAEFGVFGPAVGVIGSLQATEGLKILAQTGRDLSERIISYNANSCRFIELRRKKFENCPFCGNL